MPVSISPSLPGYDRYAPRVPVWCVTPSVERTIHRYFDSSPFSPSGRFLLSTQLPAENRLPEPGQKAKIVVTDLSTGEQLAVAESLGWDTQVGAHAHWGADDSQVLFNDLDRETWRPFAVRLNLSTGDRQELEGPIYSVSHDRRFSIAPNLSRTGLVQAGYGVIVPDSAIQQRSWIPEDDGVFRVDLQSGAQQMIVSLREIIDAVGDPFDAPRGEPGRLLGFHMALNRPADRLLFIIRWVRDPTPLHGLLLAARRWGTFPFRWAAVKLGMPRLRRALRLPPMVLNSIVTMRPDGSDIRVVLGAREYSAGGHHPNWTPDGRSILMNLSVNGTMRFVLLDGVTGQRRVLHPEAIGSGHPTMHPDMRHILTDAYPFEPVAYPDGTVPLRWIDCETGCETALARIGAHAAFRGPKLELRVDPHPAWSDDFSRIAFNGYADGTRRVYVADMSSLDQIEL